MTTQGVRTDLLWQSRIHQRQARQFDQRPHDAARRRTGRRRHPRLAAEELPLGLVYVDAACSGSLTLDFSTPTFNRLRTDALRVYDATGVLVFGTKRSDPFPTGRGTFVVSPGRYTIAAY